MLIRSIVFLLAMATSYQAKSQDIGFQEAKRAAALLDIVESPDPNGECARCHQMQDRDLLDRWARQTRRVFFECLKDQLTPIEKVNCLKKGRTNFTASAIGFYSSASHLEIFKNMFSSAYGSDTGPYDDFLARVAMPRGPYHRFTEDQWPSIERWVISSLPHLDEIIDPYNGDLTCKTEDSAKLQEYLSEREFFSWATKHQEQRLRSYGCYAPNPMDCFVNNQGNPIAPLLPQENITTEFNGRSFLLHEFDDTTDFWIRTSADGRFVGYGGNDSYIVDLQSKLSSDTTRKILIDAYYDPSFFPNNKAFMFQGNSTGVCSQSLLEDLSVTAIDFSEAACSYGEDVATPLYQAVGNSLNDERYWAVTGSFESDAGNFNLANNRETSLSIHPYHFDGQKWYIQDEIKLPTPYEIDWNTSPSTNLFISRKSVPHGGSQKFLGYQIYKLDAKVEGDQLDYLGRFCTPGLKGKFSFDERFFVSYGYVEESQFRELGFESPDDPQFRKLVDSRSSIVYLTDLYTMESTPLNKPMPGQRLLFPHFRADGWIYLLYFDSQNDRRYLIANRLAIEKAQANSLMIKR